jgi:hypothetical protein
MNRWRVGEDRGSKETDRCPLTITPSSKRGITMCEDRQEVARSTLVKGIKLKVAALIWCAALGCLQWNCAIFSDMIQTPWPHVDRSKLTLSDAYRSSYAEDDDFPHIER